MRLTLALLATLFAFGLFAWWIADRKNTAGSAVTRAEVRDRNADSVAPGLNGLGAEIARSGLRASLERVAAGDDDSQIEFLRALRVGMERGTIPPSACLRLLLTSDVELPPRIVDTCLAWVASHRADLVDHTAEVLDALLDNRMDILRLRLLLALQPVGNQHVARISRLMDAYPENDNLFAVVFSSCEGAAYAPIARRILAWKHHWHDPHRTSVLSLDERIRFSTGAWAEHRAYLKRLGFAAAAGLADYLLDEAQGWVQPEDADGKCSRPRAWTLMVLVDQPDVGPTARLIREADTELLQEALVAIPFYANSHFWVDGVDDLCQALLERIRTTDGALRDAAFAALGECGDSALPALESALASKDKDLQRSALLGLSDSMDDARAKHIVELVRTNRLGVSDVLCEVLYLYEAHALPILRQLIEGLSDEAFNAGWHADIAYYDPRALEPLLEDAHPRVARRAHCVAARLEQHPITLQLALRPGLNHADPVLRRCAVHALAAYHPGLVLAHIEQDLNSPDLDIACEAISAAARAGSSARHLATAMLLAYRRQSTKDRDPFEIAKALSTVLAGDYSNLESLLRDGKASPDLPLRVLTSRPSSFLTWVSRTPQANASLWMRRIVAGALEELSDVGCCGEETGGRAQRSLRVRLNDTDLQVRGSAARVHVHTKELQATCVDVLLQCLGASEVPSPYWSASALSRVELTPVQQEQFEAFRIHPDTDTANFIREVRLKRLLDKP